MFVHVPYPFHSVHMTFYLHSPEGAHLGGPHLLTTVNNTDVNIGVQAESLLSILLVLYLRVNLPCHMVVLCGTCRETTKVLPKATALFHSPANNGQRARFSTS